MSKVIGLTGGIATGKSAASDDLIALGIPTLDLDAITHELEQNNHDLIQQIYELFGPASISNGQVNRKALGKMVFTDHDKMKQLVQIVNPFVFRTVKEELNQLQDRHLVILNAPTLFENGFQILTDSNLMITCDPMIQIKRLMKRNNVSISQASKMIGSQWSQSIKSQLSDWCIDNSGTPAQLKSLVRDWYTLVSDV
ncbi:dephospho-CoA kinase [Fructilactobacillus fructivorans]|uniref:Dephospho-CoA kinase n=1 Tax=Fructilactobacillus fructivorans TaxID=1614 RepID=A0AAE6TW52_9LACO|nr:dephospho-CoA kinase [Fructilactobacillus fructivorans]KRK58542.1 dephospho-CoA kinase [Fructilactobacillus fructivorans]KRN13387.1 dephospho-CoA kinase [Fructilactobacillus fructivorans]QFX92549.1 dephospho-CoA kinase [Fructilactobacillus fructivorans]RDV65856.1 dephospho-CoA kinase [Fructilactobacillus fructivorans]